MNNVCFLRNTLIWIHATSGKRTNNALLAAKGDTSEFWSCLLFSIPNITQKWHSLCMTLNMCLYRVSGYGWTNICVHALFCSPFADTSTIRVGFGYWQVQSYTIINDLISLLGGSLPFFGITPARSWSRWFMTWLWLFVFRLYQKYTKSNKWCAKLHS